MKYIKTYENKNKDIENVELLDDLLKENPLSKDNDFYIFIGHDDFKETEDGLYKKTLDIENMVRIQPDMQSLTAMKFLPLRVRFQPNSELYHIWLPIELRNEIEGKSSSMLDDYLVDLINKYKIKGIDDKGRETTRDVIKRREDIKKFNL